MLFFFNIRFYSITLAPPGAIIFSRDKKEKCSSPSILKAILIEFIPNPDISLSDTFTFWPLFNLIVFPKFVTTTQSSPIVQVTE